MKKILYLASFDIGKRTGGGLASLCYYNALCAIRPGKVDLMMNEECCIGQYNKAIKIPPRHGLEYLTDFSIHRGRRFVISYIKSHSSEYDICFINCSRYGGDMMEEIKKAGLKIVMIHHNYEVEFCMDNKYIITLYGRFSKIVKYYERKAYKKADVNCFLTATDQKLITSAYGTSSAPNILLGVFDPVPYKYERKATTETNTMIISGSMNDYQTYHSLELFERDYYNIIKLNYPQLKIIITGRNPHESIYAFQKRNSDNIRVVANPEDIEEVVGIGEIFLCPTCIGGGLKLRVMDGLKMGIPVLVHRISARGYEAFKGKPYFQVYDSKGSFEKGLSAILSFLKQKTNYKCEIINTYEKVFGFNAGVERMRSVLNSI